VREVLKQSEREALSACEQIAILLALNNGLFDDLGIEEVAEAERAIRAGLHPAADSQCHTIDSGEMLSAEDQDYMLASMRDVIGSQGAGFSA
jgi:F-type H+/Na+-transporting ATPase subunit alpha